MSFKLSNEAKAEKSIDVRENDKDVREIDVHLALSLLRRGSSIRYINPLCEVYRRRKVEWIDQGLDQALSAVACNSVPALILLSGSSPPEKKPLSLCGGESIWQRFSA